MTPKRIQRKRTKGWRMPEGAVYVGRPTKWGNPFRARVPQDEKDGTQAAVCCVWFRRWLSGEDGLGMATTGAGGLALAQAAREELRGKNLACWCPPGISCHADILIEIANREET